MSRFLERLNIERYGALVGRDVGPFSSGLNVVYGPNEAGKSTIASFVGGVLFGWEDGHGVRNTYSPKTGDRSGTLFFSDGTTANRSGESGAMGGDAHPTSDIDAVTFKTIFSLTADELRSLRGSSDVTARLLTAGSGTGASPAGAFVELEQRIAKLVSRSPEDSESVFNLEDALDEQREQVKQLADEEKRRKREDAELCTLLEDREITSRHLSDVSRALEKLSAGRVRVEQIDQQAIELEREIFLTREEREGQEAGQPENEKLDSKLMQLDAIAERSLRDKLDEYADEQAKATRGVDIAKENAAASAAAYEALVEMDAESLQNKDTRKTKGMLVALPAALAVGFALAGIPVFVHARAINSLSLTALGIGLVVFACLLAIAAVALVARPDKSIEALTSRQQDAQWVMLQDKKKLDTNMAAKQLLDTEVASFLDDAGLAAANGSIRQARALLDDAREARSDEQVRQQRIASLDMREASARKALDEIMAERKSLIKSLEFGCESTVDDISDEIALKQEQQQALAQTCDDMNMRIGELTERLDQARGDRTFDLAKLQYQQTRVRLRDAKHELVTLLLARRMLERSIVAWVSRSQPEVYRKASELFETITDEAWRQISMTTEGRLLATAADGTVREVRHLSLGTCQQLYLSLRIAVLIHAESVGRSIPVLADDILVNFDAARRQGAARALAELASKRQVIVFTCHRETVEALRKAQPDLNYLEL